MGKITVYEDMEYVRTEQRRDELLSRGWIVTSVKPEYLVMVLPLGVYGDDAES